MTPDQTKEALIGRWTSIATEIRPSAVRNEDGTLKPFYLRRDFRALGDDRFELTIVNSADAHGAVPLARIAIRGHMVWRGPHPIAPGAQKVDFVADEGYEVTPLIQGFADVLDRVAKSGHAPWAVNVAQSVFGKASRRSASSKVDTSWNSTWSISTTTCCSGAPGTSTAVASTAKRTGRPTCRFRWPEAEVKREHAARS